MERINGSGSKVYGFSFDFGLILGPKLNFSSGWTIQRSKLDEPEPNFNCREFFRTPNSYGYVTMNYKNDRLINMNISMEYTGKMKVPHFAGYIEKDILEITSPFYVVNVKFDKTINFSENTNIRFFIGAYNILDSYQKDLDKGADRDSGYVYGPAKPRAFYTGFEFSF